MDVQCSWSAAAKRTYFICARLTAIEDVFNLFQATILGSLSVGTTGSLTRTGTLKILKISKVFMLSKRGIDTITKTLPFSKTVVQVRVWYQFQISPFGSYGIFKNSGKGFSISNSKPFKCLGVMTDGKRCPSERMFNCYCTCSTYELACQTVLLIACLIESSFKYNCTHCPTWNTSFSNVV